MSTIINFAAFRQSTSVASGKNALTQQHQIEAVRAEAEQVLDQLLVILNLLKAGGLQTDRRRPMDFSVNRPGSVTAPLSHEMEPPVNPERFTSPHSVSTKHERYWPWW